MQQLPDIFIASVAKSASLVPAALIESLLGLFFLATLLKLFGRPKRSKAIPAINNLCQKQLLTSNEQKFFARLCRALPAYYVFPQVAFNALLDNKDFMPYADWRFLRRTFHSLVADFVICDRTTFQVIAVVELDDKTHDNKQEADGRRDAMLKTAGYRVERFKSKDRPSDTEIAGRIEGAGTGARQRDTERSI